MNSGLGTSIDPIPFGIRRRKSWVGRFGTATEEPERERSQVESVVLLRERDAKPSVRSLASSVRALARRMHSACVWNRNRRYEVVVGNDA